MKKIWKLDLAKVIGRGYADFWHFRGRYRVVKGSRASKKSKTTALWYMVHLHKYPSANLLVVRQVYRTLKDSCFADLQWAARRLNIANNWTFSKSPSLEIRNKKTGQCIYFRGLDEPMKIASITAHSGKLCWLWIEEAFEVVKEEDFNLLDESIRGAVDNGLFKQITLTFNPWDERHWIKKRFFDAATSAEVLALSVNYQTNEFLDQSDLDLFARMKAENPKRYQVAGLGHWGIAEGLIYENWKQEQFDIHALFEQTDIQPIFGLDFGFTHDPTAIFCGAVNKKAGRLYVWDERYETGLSNAAIFRLLEELQILHEVILADSAEPKSIDELKRLGARKIRGVKKGADSVRFGILALQDYEIIVHPKCRNFIREISAYTWSKNNDGRKGPDPKAENHLMDAMRYAMEDIGKAPRFGF